MIDPNASIRRVPGVLGTDTSEQRVLLNEKFEYLGLDQFAQRVWDLLEEPQTLRALVQVLTVEYDVAPEQCASDLQGFLRQMVQHRLIEIA